MRVAIAGGHGKIGRHLIGLLVKRGDEVVSLDRNPDYGPALRELGAEPVVCDLENASEEDVAEAVGDADAVVFAAGAGPGSGPERKWTMDHAGAVKLASAAKSKGIRRFVIVSSIGADADTPGDETFSVYLRAKGQADDDIAAMDLEHTIVRPTSLSDDPGTGRVQAGPTVERKDVPREDVAAALAEVLAATGTAGKTFELTSGEIPVAEAIAAL